MTSTYTDSKNDCKKYTKGLLRMYSRNDALELINNKITSQGKKNINIECKVCDSTEATGARAYFSYPPCTVTMCVNRVDKGSEGDALLHELIHAYDHCSNKLDLGKVEDLACSEIRAAREAECESKIRSYNAYTSYIFPRGFNAYILDRYKRDCTITLAKSATKMMFHEGQVAEEAVEKVFEECYADVTPFAS